MNTAVLAWPKLARILVVQFQWRGSYDGVVWAGWVNFTRAEIEQASLALHKCGYMYVQARKLENGVEVSRSKMETMYD